MQLISKEFYYKGLDAISEIFSGPLLNKKELLTKAMHLLKSMYKNDIGEQVYISETRNNSAVSFLWSNNRFRDVEIIITENDIEYYICDWNPKLEVTDICAEQGYIVNDVNKAFMELANWLSCKDYTPITEGSKKYTKKNFQEEFIL